MIGIYKIVNTVNGKVYIGQSKDIEKRWKDHIRWLDNNYHNNNYLQNAWNKYGRENFIFEIVVLCEIDELDIFECLYIEKHDSFYPAGCGGYNLTAGGSGQRGRHLSDKHKKAISDFHTGKVGVWRDKSLCEEHKEKISKSLKGRDFSEEHRENLRNANIGGKNPASKKVVCDGVEYSSIQEFCDKHGLKRTTVSNWLNGNRTMNTRYKNLGLTYID